MMRVAETEPKKPRFSLRCEIEETRQFAAEVLHAAALFDVVGALLESAQSQAIHDFSHDRRRARNSFFTCGRAVEMIAAPGDAGEVTALIAQQIRKRGDV